MLLFHPMRSDSEDDTLSLFSLLQQASQFSLLVQGRLPTLEDARCNLSELPPGKGATDKVFGGYWNEGALVGCMDLVHGYPEPDIAYLGLLLFSESVQGKGFGVEALAHISALARSRGCTQLRLAVHESNARAHRFWQRTGFAEICRRPMVGYTSGAIVMQNAL